MLGRFLDFRSPFANRRRPLPLRKKLRWRGRRWYDPNVIKLIWTTVCLTLLSSAIKFTIYLFTVGYSNPLAAATFPTQGVAGTPHDLSSTGPRTVTTAKDACIFCHLPHGTVGGITLDVPVWNHETTAATFHMYSSTGLKGAIDSQPTGPSLACLSCHDGTVAMGTLHDAPTGGGETDYSAAQGGIDRDSGKMVGRNVLPSDLSSVHPISIAYRDDLVPNLRPPGGLVGVKLYPANVRGAKVQCPSCHDPHNFGLQGDTAPFLRVTQIGSALCFACHRI